METLLKKIGNEYKLYAQDDSCIATTHESPYKRLSKQNCDEIFGVVDVEKLACDECHIDIEAYKIIQTLKSGKSLNEHGFEALVGGFIKGFNKAMELNKDKLFTVEDMKNAIINAIYCTSKRNCIENMEYSEIENEFRVSIKDQIQELQPPTEIEVEVLMIHGFDDVNDPISFSAPKLDKDGCLILKRK